MSKDLIYGPLPSRDKTVSDLQLIQAALEAALNDIRARDRRIAKLEAALKVIERRLRFPCNDTEESMRDVARAALAGKEQENASSQM